MKQQPGEQRERQLTDALVHAQSLGAQAVVIMDAGGTVHAYAIERDGKPEIRLLK